MKSAHANGLEILSMGKEIETEHKTSTNVMTDVNDMKELKFQNQKEHQIESAYEGKILEENLIKKEIKTENIITDDDQSYVDDDQKDLLHQNQSQESEPQISQEEIKGQEEREQE